MGMLMLGVLSASAGEAISAVVDGINVLSSATYFTDVIGSAGATDVKIASGVINDNHARGWKLTVTSAHNGKLIDRAASTEIVYTNIKLVKGPDSTIGFGLEDVSGSSESIAGGSCEFNPGGSATAATVDYAFELQISWTADNSLVAGTYKDTITMTLAVDEES
jgi:hypothetical protein